MMIVKSGSGLGQPVFPISKEYCDKCYEPLGMRADWKEVNGKKYCNAHVPELS